MRLMPKPRLVNGKMEKCPIWIDFGLCLYKEKGEKGVESLWNKIMDVIDHKNILNWMTDIYHPLMVTPWCDAAKFNKLIIKIYLDGKEQEVNDASNASSIE